MVCISVALDHWPVTAVGVGLSPVYGKVCEIHWGESHLTICQT